MNEKNISMADEYFRGIISATSEEEAQQILNMLLEKKLIAGGLISNGMSNHWWEGKIDKEIYYNISVFTISENKEKIVDLVEKNSKDNTPGVIFFKIDYANDKFLRWISENTK